MRERGGHVCWVFDDPSFPRTATTFLQEGLERHERLVFVADGSSEESLLGLLADLDDVERLAAEGALAVVSVRDLYVPGGTIDPARQVETYASLTMAALAEGFAGLRVAADATLLVEDPAWRADFIRYEVAVDRFMSRFPMTAMCAYDVRVLGAAAAELACVHPKRHVGQSRDPGFCLYHGADALHLEGEVDIANHELLERALDAAAATADGPDVVLDVTGLAFIDIGGLDRMRRLADRLEGQLVVRGAADVVRRCWSAIGNDAPNVVWEPAA